VGSSFRALELFECVVEPPCPDELHGEDDPHPSVQRVQCDSPDAGVDGLLGSQHRV